MKIVKITELPEDLHKLIHESEQEGYEFVKRLADEWNNKTNRFDDNGEFLLGASSNNSTIGVCGINIDPYLSDPSVARLRHLYVLPAFRKQEVGSKLVRQCLANLSAAFNSVRLRVPNASTGQFYEKIGFKAIDHTTATHRYTCS